MDMQLDPSAGANDTVRTGTTTRPIADPAPSAGTAGPTGRYALVEDLEHLYQTGESRQILSLRWTV